MTVNGGTVHAKANGTKAIYAYGGITLNNGEAYLLGDKDASEVQIGILEYPLWVGGVQVTSANQNDILNDGGSVRFEVTDEGENVLTLTNANIGTFHQYGTYEDNYANICCDETAYALTINLVGDNTLSNGNRGVIIGNAFRSDGALTLTGEGTLTVSDVSYGIEANGTLAIDGTTVITDSIKYCAIWGHQVDITGSTVTASGGTFGLCVGAGNLTVTDSTVTATGVEAEGLFLYGSASFGGSSVVIAESTCSDGAIRVHGEITLNDGIKMVTPEGGVYVNTGYGGKKLCLSDGETVATGAVFSKEFTISFVNEDGTELQSGMVAVGETPAYTGEEPTKPATAKYTYTFAGWTPKIVPVTGDATYTATYSSTVNEYMITFVNEDGTELQSGKVAYDETPVYTGATPEKPATAHNEYAFAGWTPKIVPVTGDATYTATYTEDLLHPTFVGSELLAYDNYIEENGELLYRFDVTAKDVLDGALGVNSMQIFVTYDHDTLAFKKGEGAVDWMFNDYGGRLSAVWASDTDVEIKEGDAVLTLWFAVVGELPESGIVDIAFVENSLGNVSALSFVNEGTVLELEARTEDGFIQFDALLYGDANCDGKVTSADASLILRALVGLSELSPRGALQADVDLDGEVTAEDAALILRYMVGLIDELPLA
jgi:hypothetical protein